MSETEKAAKQSSIFNQVDQKDIRSFEESLRTESEMDFRKEIIEARLVYAESPSDANRFAYAYYLLKSDKVNLFRFFARFFMSVFSSSDIFAAIGCE